ncbi:hypothetical protein X801_00959, partial [Opisthorchis viverrini]
WAEYRRHRTTTTWEKYRLLRNKVNVLVVNDKKDYQLMLLEKMEKNPKLLYRIINNKASVKPGISPLHTPNGLTATASAAAEELAEFYSTVYCQKEYISRMSFMSPSLPTSLHEVIVTPKCVLRTLLELNHRKSTGADQITPFILKQKNRSCLCNLLITLDDWTQPVDNGNPVHARYLDISKAFDRVNHNISLQKLEHYGITGKLLAWLETYLADRDARVCVDGALSKPIAATNAVLQGSVFGPTLFLL